MPRGDEPRAKRLADVHRRRKHEPARRCALGIGGLRPFAALGLVIARRVSSEPRTGGLALGGSHWTRTFAVFEPGSARRRRRGAVRSLARGSRGCDNGPVNSSRLPLHVRSAACALGAASFASADGYIGLTLRDLPEGQGAIVSWILPGPLSGEGLVSPSFARPDLIVSVNGEPVDAASFERLVRATAPGSSLTIASRAARRRGAAIPAVLDHDDEIRTTTVTVVDREPWQGSIGRTRRSDVSFRLAPSALLDPDAAATPLGQAVAESALADAIATSRALLAKVPIDTPDAFELSAVLAAFANPFHLPEIAEAIANPACGVPHRPVSAAVELAAKALDLPLPKNPGFGTYELKESRDAIFALEFLLDEPRLMFEAALGARAGSEAFARQCLTFLAVPSTTFYIQGPEAQQAIDVIRAALTIDCSKFLDALHHLDGELAIDMKIANGERKPIPDELKGAMEGELLNSQFIPGVGWCVVGGPGPNRYDMAKIAAVIDFGGNDRYEASALRIGNRAIIDLGGDDVYTGTPEQGPGSALLGLSLIDDRGGNDRYEGGVLSVAGAMFGAALVIDRGGDDLYRGTQWSLGAAAFGIGILADLGGGSDRYEGEFLCQGVGGPRGLGALIDDGGRDWYRAQDPHGSIYGTPAVNRAFSQGVGFGYRHYAAGGIGLLCDLGGDDRYDAGEFAQGGGYYHALGVLWDAGGRDLYSGNRYAQGFGVHQGFGALVDGGGDDSYWSMTAASQGAGWDIAAGLLLDRGGNDSYQADGLAQGAAAQQAFAFLVDLAGDDRYATNGGATQGESGGNEYHWVRTKAASFSLLLDLAGRDWFSTGRRAGVTKTGPTGAEGAGAWGLCVDH